MRKQLIILAGVSAICAMIVVVGCGKKQETEFGQATKTDTVTTQTPPTYGQTNNQPPVEQPSTTPPATTQTAPKPVVNKPVPTKPTTPPVTASGPPKAKLMTIPTGTTITVVLATKLRTDSNQTGDAFSAKTSNAIRVSDVTVLPAGSEVRGHLTHVEEPHRTSGKAEMTLVFDEIVDPSGQAHAISAAPIALEGEGDKISDEEKVAAGAVIGGVIGALTSKKKGKGALTGAAAGAAAGGAVALATKGQQLELPPGQQFSVELTGPVEVPVPAMITENK